MATTPPAAVRAVTESVPEVGSVGSPPPSLLAPCRRRIQLPLFLASFVIASTDRNELLGEHLIATIYNALVATMAKHPGREHESLFARTLLVITYDEHGGFFDRVRPPAAPQPTKKDVTDGGFRFDILGPRVPALLISPNSSFWRCN